MKLDKFADINCGLIYNYPIINYVDSNYTMTQLHKRTDIGSNVISIVIDDYESAIVWLTMHLYTSSVNAIWVSTERGLEIGLTCFAIIFQILVV